MWPPQSRLSEHEITGVGRAVSPKDGDFFTSAGTKTLFAFVLCSGHLVLQETLLAQGGVLLHRAGMGEGHGGGPSPLDLRCAKVSDWERL